MSAINPVIDDQCGFGGAGQRRTGSQGGEFFGHACEVDPTVVIGWAGRNHVEQAQALPALLHASERAGWLESGKIDVLAGLVELLP